MVKDHANGKNRATISAYMRNCFFKVSMPLWGGGGW